MQLKSLTLNGFKSFADKTTIEFTHGLTGIVGPNGSGKSNITEAIRWALGEQSAKSLRGERMGDVIFAGTDSRPALNRAEVTLTFDNSDGFLHDQGAEVTVSRRLFRDGTSEFMLNGKSVRLHDVLDLFMDSGLGRDSFAFISQGRVEAIFNSKPEDRRSIFEEAAGVLKYKLQKQKAQGQLQETSDNLARVHDIVHELSGRMEPLAEQASIAKDYAQQSKEHATLRQQLLALEIRDLSADQEQAQTAAEVNKRKIAELNGLIKQLETKSDAATKADNELTRKLDAVNDELLSKSMQQETLNGEENVSTERVQNAATTLADLKEQLTDAQTAKRDAQTHLTKLQKQHEQLIKQSQDLQKQLKDMQRHGSSSKSLQEQLDAAQGEYIDTMQRQADTRNQLVALEKEQQLSASQLKSTQGRLAELSTQEQQLQAKLQTLTTALDEAKQQHETTTANASQAQAALNTAQERLEAAQVQLRQHRSQYAQAQTRYNTLKEMSEDYTGFYAGVRAVLKSKDELPGVIGAVAELLQVPQKYQAAIDQALGANLQAIVTTNEAAAKGAIAHLKRMHAGRATFLPTDVVRPRQLGAGIETTLARQQGFIGVAAELVHYDDAVASVMRNLMGTLLLVDNLDNAVHIAGAINHRYRIVTLDGDILNAGGSMSGGSRQKGSSSPLARSQELQRLAINGKAMAESIRAEEAKLDALQDKANDCQNAAGIAAEQLNTCNAKLQELNSDKRVLDEQVKQVQRQRANLQLSMPAGSVDLADKQQQLQEQAKDIASQLEELKQRQADLKQQQSDSESAAGALRERTAQLRADIAVADTDLRTNVEQTQQWQSSLQQANGNIDRLEKRIASIQESAGVTAEEKAARKETLAQLAVDTKRLRKQQADYKQQQADGRTAMSRLSARITSAYSERQTAQTESETQAVTLNRCKINLDNRLNILADDYQTTYEAALKTVPNPEPDQPQLRSQLKLLQRGLDELGPVNPNAVAEYQEVKERFDFLTKQEGDLNSAREQLNATMAELDDEVRVRFKDVFDATSAAFTEIFPQMFGGGHAELRLTQPDDLLNTGIEIIAQPPGKKLTRLSLLSGGERALTAITLLFAILRVRPVPFSILDEVEASLDEANVERFGEFLRNYSSSTQFIVITHRRGTMVAADILYGVTMQESGVSTMVAVSIDEAVAAKKDSISQ
ncbi:chromosome segregation protein SMC [Lacticaseibacillus zhaodongensis]|uniref:chromosome segregation protein SMC n=1 Tax=Lacticaseibacillus zhaodongensis TaxID=2668065 RepID=UPI0012D2D4B9|nr:chromosome segregation protein SMC [Lacticaseibacillus zhaodongensis]